MKWLRRTDDARRMKGDPPPTVEQLLATVRQQGDVIRSLRHQCDGLIAENARLRGHVSLAEAFRDAPARFWTCPVEDHTKVEWRGNVAHCMACDRTSADVEPKTTLREERIGRRWPTWPEAGKAEAAEDHPTGDHDPANCPFCRKAGKDEQR